MSPSRGHTSPATNLSSSTTKIQPHNEEPSPAIQNSNRALSSFHTNINYLISPNNASTAQRPLRLRTRALLRSIRFLSVFIFWRAVRYAKYAVVGSIIAALSATAVGGMVSGVGWIVAPTGIVGSVGVGIMWWVGKGVWRRYGPKSKVGGDKAGTQLDRDIEAKQKRREGVVREGSYRGVQGPGVVPW